MTDVQLLLHAAPTGSTLIQELREVHLFFMSHQAVLSADAPKGRDLFVSQDCGGLIMIAGALP